MAKLIIIGGGIGGLMAAACLQRRGVEARVYEQAGGTCEIGGALALWPNATRVLRPLDLLPPLIQTGHVASMAFLRNWRGQVLTRMAMPDVGTPALFVYGAEVLAALLSTLPPGSVEWGKRFVRTERDGPRVRALFADGTTSPFADGLIGADGIRSTVRAEMLGDGAPRYRGYVVWRGVAEYEMQETIGETWGRGKRFGVVPLGMNQGSAPRAGWWATANERHPEQTLLRAPPAEWKAEVLRLFGEWHAPIRRVIEATPSDQLRCNVISDRPPRHRWGEGSVTLLGDARHPAAPDFGQGACMAIEDAAVLANAVDAIPDPASAFRVYEATRRARTAMVVRESRKFSRIGQWKNPLACALRDLGVRMSPHRTRHQRLRELWRYDAWSAPLMMPT